MEALQEAYRQIHVAEDSDDHFNKITESKTLSPTPLARGSLQPTSTNESGQTPSCCNV